MCCTYFNKLHAEFLSDDKFFRFVGESVYRKDVKKFSLVR